MNCKISEQQVNFVPKEIMAWFAVYLIKIFEKMVI